MILHLFVDLHFDASASTAGIQILPKAEVSQTLNVLNKLYTVLHFCIPLQGHPLIVTGFHVFVLITLFDHTGNK